MGGGAREYQVRLKPQPPLLSSIPPLSRKPTPPPSKKKVESREVPFFRDVLMLSFGAFSRDPVRHIDPRGVGGGGERGEGDSVGGEGEGDSDSLGRKGGEVKGEGEGNSVGGKGRGR